MRMLSRVKLKWSGAGWFWFWAAALLVLPNCTLDRSGIVTPTNVHRGVAPRSSAIFCDIERPGERHCASPEEVAGTIRRAGAAEALVAGQTSTTALDYSPESLMTCGGAPEVVEFFGNFPAGSDVCLNCASAIGPDPMTQHANNAAVCIGLCLDLFATDDVNEPPSAAALAYCTPERARLSTNFPATGCFEGACSHGFPDSAFVDPRRTPEPVDWINLNGVTASGGTLTRTAAATGNYDTGASSSQLIAGGDGYLEFTAQENITHRVAGLSNGPPPPGNLVFENINFGILLTDYGELWVSESAPGTFMSFGSYAAGEKFRVKLRDNFDGTAAVSYVRITGPCVDGSPCNETLIWNSEGVATYPIRVDAMFRDLGARVAEARIVRIR